MVERAFGALCFAPNATNKMSLFQAPQCRRQTRSYVCLTKKPLVQNLNWNKVLRQEQKSDCLDNNKPKAQKMPYPARTKWNMCSDVKYDQENINRPIDTGSLVSSEGEYYGDG